MDCPLCQAPMRNARISFERKKLGAAIDLMTETFPSPHRLCVTTDDEEVFPELAINGFYCNACDTVVLPGANAGLECFECKAPIPGTADACPKCGWSWK